MAAGLAAGLTELEAQEAAISSFGSVRAVARAHQSRSSRTAAIMTDVTMAEWVSGTGRGAEPPILAALVLAAGYAFRMRQILRHPRSIV